MKNPKRVAAGKAIAEKTRQSREAQKKALAKAAAIIANDESRKDTPEPAIPDPVNADQPTPQGSFYWGFSTTQWLMVGGIVVGLLGLYYKREEIKAATVGKLAPTVSTTVDTPAPNVGTTLDTPAPNVGTTVDTTAPKARLAPGLRKMD